MIRHKAYKKTPLGAGRPGPEIRCQDPGIRCRESGVRESGGIRCRGNPVHGESRGESRCRGKPVSVHHSAGGKPSRVDLGGQPPRSTRPGLRPVTAAEALVLLPQRPDRLLDLPPLFMGLPGSGQPPHPVEPDMPPQLVSVDDLIATEKRLRQGGHGLIYNWAN